MVWASGHNIESQRKYRVPIEKTISKVAYEKKAIQVWKNAPEEGRSFVKNPKATRSFRSMVSIPILMGDKTHGVFNIVTNREDAFDPADINYLTSLGSIIQLAFGMAVQELEPTAAKPSKKVARAAVPAPQGARILPEIEGKISSKTYARELKKEVRRVRNASTGRYVSRGGGGATPPHSLAVPAGGRELQRANT